MQNSLCFSVILFFLGVLVGTCFSGVVIQSKVKEQDSQNASSLVISVYYETLCPDSIRFITRQLYPLHKQLGLSNNSFFEIDLVPYGKANTTFGPNNTYSFVCQHGNDECEGNKMHACALQYLPPVGTNLTSSVDFINCSMSASYPPNAGPSCADQLGLDFGPIESCLTADGPALLADLGNRTHGLSPTLYYVPWIIHNSVFSEDDLWDSQSDLLPVVCRKLEELGVARPDSCE